MFLSLHRPGHVERVAECSKDRGDDQVGQNASTRDDDKDEEPKDLLAECTLRPKEYLRPFVERDDPKNGVK